MDATERSPLAAHRAMNGRISDTAFLVNESRARRVDVSLDVFARHWVVPERREAVSRLWDDFAAEVYPHDDLELSIRNRFFLERLHDFVASTENPALINVGAGFSSYPFLLESPVDSVELDLPAVIELKGRRLGELMEQGLLPDRPVELVAMDLEREDDTEVLAGVLARHAQGRPSFVLVEGVTYYLTSRSLHRLLALARKMQELGSVLAFDFWRPDIVRHPVFQRLRSFFFRRFSFQVDDYMLLDEEFIHGVEGYRVETITSAAEQEELYAGTRVLGGDPSAILEENYAILRRWS